MSSPLSRETQADLLRLIEWVEVSSEKPDLVAFLRDIADSTEAAFSFYVLTASWGGEENGGLRAVTVKVTDPARQTARSCA